jgi:hypothetical protein
MRLGVSPIAFLGRLLLFFFLTYFLWKPLEPAYTHLLAALTGGFLHLTEMSSDPNFNQVTEMHVRETVEGRPAIFYQHRRFPQVQSGIPAEWVQANLVLLIPLMLATPSHTYQQKLKRVVLALGIAVALQVLDIAVTVKALYAREIPGYGNVARWLYQFGDAFVQGMDTQLFPFAIWAGIHFNQLLGRGVWAAGAAPHATAQGAPGGSKRPHRRRATKGRASPR